MKFINYLESITGIGIFPMTSLLIFFLFFTGVILYSMSIRKSTIEELKQIPLDNDQNDSSDDEKI
ncbi:MAG: CcoQ/FixQ family Cbb3-type cytochrome c oxidase assembly chaperone [Saprospirales bacterium]|nr:MAG: CcoQ/FixQ family Cbb3-type cytochrome c oxidase assembly chaperone [Saprospirales bacterium]